MMLLCTTTDLKGPRRVELQRLLASLAASRSVPIRHYLLLQNCTEDELAEFRRTAPGCCRVSRSAQRLSISLARNRLLEQALADGFEDDCIVGFPDDDCWYPDAFLGRLSDLFSSEATLDLLVCGISLTPSSCPFTAANARKVLPHELVRWSSSNSVFIRGRIARNLGPFDLGLGLGAPAGSGEDTDYAIRAFLRAGDPRIIEQSLVGHPKQDAASAAKYFGGAFLVLARHSAKSPALRAEFIRKIFVGIYFVGRRKLSPSSYGQALLRALRESHSSRRAAA